MNPKCIKLKPNQNKAILQRIRRKINLISKIDKTCNEITQNPFYLVIPIIIFLIFRQNLRTIKEEPFCNSEESVGGQTRC